jgi:tetratricopeptide (TPR) repeat protein
LGFLGIWFFGILAPTSSFIPIQDLAFEYRMYLPLASVITLTVILGYHFLRNHPFLAKGSLFLLAVPLATLTFMRNQDYQSEIRIWQDTVTKRPGNWRAYGNLGTALLKEGKAEEAFSIYREALKVNPDYVLAHYNMATILDAQGKLDEAIQHYQKALQIDPNYADAHSNLGTILASQGKLDEAVFHYLKTLGLNPAFAEGYYNLGNAYLKQGRFSEAMTQYSKALELKPGLDPARDQLKIALAKQRELEG